MESYDVVVVGAGPVGLLTAIELTLSAMPSEIRVLVLERLATPSSVTKALSIGALGTEALQRRGMSAAIDAAEDRAFAAIQQFMEQNGAGQRGKGSKFSGHFGGLTLIRKDAQKEPDRRARIVDQHAVEAMLTDRALALGIEIRRECEVTGFIQDADAVDVEWKSPINEQINGQASEQSSEQISSSAGESAAVGHIRCSYLVGCDGGRSRIRKMAGFDFPGSSPTLTMYTAMVEIDHPELLLPIGWRRTSGGVFSYGPFPGRLFMLDFSGPPPNRDAPVTREEFEAVLRNISGQDVRVKTLQSGSRWTDNTRLVDTYRRGRILLAGDAAHIHSPFGGQGMSLGLVDAQNLGWKLAAVIRGTMPESLLETYTAERRPVAEAVLENTLAQTAIMRPDPQSGAMRQLMANLLQLDDVNRFIGEMMSGLATRYDLAFECDQELDSAPGRSRSAQSMSAQDDVGRLIGDRPVNDRRFDHAIPADSPSSNSLPEISQPGISLFALMQDGSGVLLDASSGGEATRLAQASTPKINCVAVDSGQSMLIRPDACVVWAADENSLDGLEEALHRWFPSNR